MGKRVLFRKIRGRIVPIIDKVAHPHMSGQIEHIRALRKGAREAAKKMKTPKSIFKDSATLGDKLSARKVLNTRIKMMRIQASAAGSVLDIRIKKLLRKK